MYLRRALPALVVALAALTGCASIPTGGGGSGSSATSTIPELAPDQQVTIRWESYNLASAGLFGKTVTELVAEFEKQHPNIHVDAVPPQGGIGEIVQSVQRQVVAGTPPDVAQLTFAGLRYAASDLGAQPIDKLVGTDAVHELLGGGPHPYNPRAAILGDVDGITYGIPYVFSTPMLFYNADLFRKAGLDPDKPPATWDEVRAAATAIGALPDTSGAYVSCVDPAQDGEWCLQGIIRSNGGRVLSADAKTVSWAEPQSVQAIAMLQQLAQAGPRSFPNITGADGQDAFLRGRMGMLLSTTALQNAILKAGATGGFEVRAAPMPGFGATPSVPTNSGSALFILTKDPAKQRAAWELIKFLTSAKTETTITEKIGYVPLRSSLVDDPDYLKGFADANPGFVRTNIAQLARLEPWVAFPGPNFTQIRTLLARATEDVVFHGADPQTTLSTAQTAAQTLMPQ